MLDKQNHIYLVDFGISKLTNCSKQFVSNKNLRFVGIDEFYIGTPRYASVAAHQRKQQLPKD